MGAVTDVWIRISQKGRSRQAIAVWVAQEPGVLVFYSVRAKTFTR